MRTKLRVRLLIPLCALALIAGACGDDDDEPGGAGATESPSGGGQGGGGADFAGLGGWDDGPCDEAAEPVVVGTTSVIESANLDLSQEVDMREATVEAFNERGGVNGRCLELVICDGKGDPNGEVNCARDFVNNNDLVAVLGPRMVANAVGAYQLFEPAQLAQVGGYPGALPEFQSPLSYEFTVGGTGTSLAQAAAIEAIGVKKFAMIRIDVPQAGALRQLVQPIVTSLDMELVAEIPVPRTATEFTQFITQAENSGAEGAILPLDQSQATQVLDAAAALSSDIKFSVSWGTYTRQSVIDDIPPEIAANTAFNDSTPPATADQERWPILQVIIEDAKRSDEEALQQPDTMKSNDLVSWLGVYGFVKVLRDADLTDITRATVKQALDQATNVDMFDIVPPWTPAAKSDNQVFSAQANTKYWTGSWNGDEENFEVGDEQVDLVPLLKGTPGQGS